MGGVKTADADGTAAVDRVMLLVTVFVAAICGLVYELIAGTLSSYLLGDSVAQFSIVIGVFLAAMGLGSFLSKRINKGLLSWFIAVELAVGAIGGSIAFIGFAAFAYTELYIPILLTLIVGIGVLVGMEIPLVVRILEARSSLRLTLANVLSVDYLGALIASLIFPFLLLPHVGLVRAGVLMGLCNVAVGLLLLHRLRGAGVKLWPRLLPAGWTAACALTALLVGAGELTLLMEDQLYQDTVILAQDTRYQRLVVTRWRDDVRLYLDGHLQFSTVDEYRYHEALVHPAMSLAPQREHVLLLGGGDGLATREILKYRDVARVDLVDLDPAVTNLFRDNKMLSVLNEGSLRDERVTIHNDDAMRFMESMSERYDVIFMDLPDPSEPGLGKLYSRAFFTLIGRSLRAGGTFAAQCTSPFRSRAAYWSIIHTIEAARWGGEREARFHAAPYHTMVPTFGTWGFVVATTHDIDTSQIRINVPTRYLSDQLLPTLFVFPQDMNRMDAPVSLLNDPIVVRLYRDGYHQHLD